VSDTILRTKLHVPPARPKSVPRRRLLSRLEDDPAAGLILISAPAGFGKTTLLAQWAAASPTPVAWLSLDEADNDPVRFARHLVAALQSADARLGDAALAMLHSPQAPQVEAALTALVNQLAAHDAPLVVVLDDYHEINAPPVHAQLAFLLAHRPPRLRLAISTRADPPLPLSRWRGRGQLIELRQADLRFTVDESAEFMRRVSGLSLSADENAALAARIEGWAAGLQLAACALNARAAESDAAGAGPADASGRQPRDGADISRLVRDLTTDNRFLLDYLLDEVLQRQPRHIQDFLLRTSILERLTGSLCDALLDEGAAPVDGQATLDGLERANLFIAPLDGERRWYRYHRLFADLLRKHLRQGARPGEIAGLHARASDWHERNGLFSEAIQHALWAEDTARAARLIEAAAEPSLKRSEVATFLRWTDALPPAEAQARPLLRLYRAWAQLLMGRPLALVEADISAVSERADLAPGAVAAMRAYIAATQGDMPRAGAFARQALDQLPVESAFLREIAAWIGALCQINDGDVEAGTSELHALIQSGRASGNIVIVSAALCRLADLRARQGRLRQARAIYEQAILLATDAQGGALPVAGAAKLGLAYLAYEWNELAEAEQLAEASIALFAQWRESASYAGYLILASVRQARGDAAGADAAAREARAIALNSDATEIDDLVAAMQDARLRIRQGDLDAAQRWASERGLLPPGGAPRLQAPEDFIEGHLRKYERLVVCHWLLAMRQAGEALATLDALLPSIEQHGRVDLLIEIESLRALAFRALGDDGRALAALDRALSLAEPDGYARVFIDEGWPMAELLRLAQARGPRSDYAGRLLAGFEAAHSGERPLSPTPTAPAPAPARQASLAEPLSERETDVLRLLGTACTIQEIAAQFVVAESTVRSHVKNIYGKLGVHSRYQAVARARELGLL
jgi:LuxR family maltose regulon positive regulatory protein